MGRYEMWVVAGVIALGIGLAMIAMLPPELEGLRNFGLLSAAFLAFAVALRHYVNGRRSR